MLGFFPKSVRDYIRAIHGNEQLSPEQVIEQVVTYLADPPSTETVPDDLLGAYLIHLGHLITSREDTNKERWTKVRELLRHELDAVEATPKITESGFRKLYDYTGKHISPSSTRAFIIAMDTIDILSTEEQNPFTNDALRHLIHDRTNTARNRVYREAKMDPDEYRFFGKILWDLSDLLSSSIVHRQKQAKKFSPEESTQESFIELVDASLCLHKKYPHEFPTGSNKRPDPKKIPRPVLALSNLFCSLSETNCIQVGHHLLANDGYCVYYDPTPHIGASSPAAPRPLAA